MSLLSQLLNSCYTYESGFELISSVVTAGKKGKEKKKDRKKKERLKKSLFWCHLRFIFPLLLLGPLARAKFFDSRLS